MFSCLPIVRRLPTTIKKINNNKKNCKSFVVVMYYKGELNELKNFSINLQSKREFSQCQLENSFGHLYYCNLHNELKKKKIIFMVSIKCSLYSFSCPLK